MNAEEKTLKDINKGTVMTKTPITIHISYNEDLTLKEFSEVLDLINKAINDVNRENGIKDNAKLGKEYATEVTGVDSGSIVVHVLSSFVAPIALSVLANFLYDRLKNLGARKGNKSIKEDAGYPISISVNGDNNLIEFNITKPSDNGHNF